MKLYKNTTFLICLLFSLIFSFSCRRSVESDGLSPSEALKSFEIAEGFQIELVASEPLVADPVAMEIDEYGQMYVIQMHGYPLDKEGSGSVQLLRDTDGDGVMDKSITFAKGLTLPNGIMRWKKGVLVTDAPHVIYLEDSDGDGMADIRDTILTGFALSNPQHKVNTPIYGLDNWIYLANEPATGAKIYVEEFGDMGKEVRYANLKNGPILPQNANGRRVRFRPDQQGLEMLSTSTQFSNAQDVLGRHFLGDNTNHIYHEVINARYLTRNNLLEVPSSTQTMSSYGMPADVYSITENPEHQIFTSVGMFTSACGVVLYGGGLFPKPFDQVAFVAEPVSNIVHAAVVEEEGSSFKASRLYEKKEFLASRDPWFRPVNHYVGPDGALYVVDYYRRYIEHPEWMGEDVVNSGALYDGLNKGRIYRITPKGAAATDWKKIGLMGDMQAAQLIPYLSHDNAWYRKTAQRLLVDRQDMSVAKDIQKVLFEGGNALGRLHAAWTLEGLGTMNVEVVEHLLKDPEAGLRENAIRLAELLLPKHPELINALIAVAEDSNSHVLFQLLCTLGDFESEEVKQVTQKLLFSNKDNSWMQIAALSARQPDYEKLLYEAIRLFNKDESADAQLVTRLSAMYASQGGVAQLKSMLNKALNTKDVHKGVWQSAMIRGLTRKNTTVDFKGKEFDNVRMSLLSAAFTHDYELVRKSSMDFLRLTGLPKEGVTVRALNKSIRTLTDSRTNLDDRLHALSFLSIDDSRAHEQLFYSLITPNEPIEIQKAALRVLGEGGKIEVAQYLRDHWKELSPQLRDLGIGVFLADSDRTLLLIESLEAGAIDPSSIDFYRQIHMMTLEDEVLRKRTRTIFADVSKDEGRREVIESYNAALSMKGDVENGRLIFEKNCANCHQLGGKHGIAYGPDIGTVRNWRAETILINILDPSLSIADGYDLWEIALTTGQTRQGIIASETPTTIVLNMFGAEPEIINRQDIQSMRALGVTIMTPGLENLINKQEMADLLAFIKRVE